MKEGLQDCLVVQIIQSEKMGKGLKKYQTQM